MSAFTIYEWFNQQARLQKKPTKPAIDPVVKRLFEEQEYDVFLGHIPEEIKKPSNIIIYGDGEYLLRENSIGRFFCKTNERHVPTLDSGPEAFFEFKLPLIPVSILSSQIAFYRSIMHRHKNSEAYTLILWDKKNEEYLLVCPEQEVSGATVKYQLDLTAYPSSQYIQVVSCHSHNSMAAFFSGTDDSDEQGDMLYMVVGKLNQPVPTFKIRANMKGNEVSFLELSELFEIGLEEYNLSVIQWTGSRQDLFPQEWLPKVKPLQFVPHSKHVSLGSKSRFPWKRPGVASHHHLISGDLGNRYKQLNFFGGGEAQTTANFDQRVYDVGVEIVITCMARDSNPEDTVFDAVLGFCDSGYVEVVRGALETYVESEEDNGRVIDRPGEEVADFFDEAALVQEHLKAEESRLIREFELGSRYKYKEKDDGE